MSKRDLFRVKAVTFTAFSDLLNTCRSYLKQRGKYGIRSTNKQKKKNYSTKQFVIKVVDTEVSLSTFPSSLWCSLQFL